MSETTIIVAAALEIIAIAVAAWLGYLGVVRQMDARRLLEKQTNSVNVMLSLFNDRDLLEASRTVSAIADDPEDDAAKYAHPPHAGLTDEQRDKWTDRGGVLRALVNFFETVSVGIRHDIYDKEIIRGCARAMFVKTHARTAGFILKSRERHNTPTYGEYFDIIAADFAAKPPPKPQ